MPLPTTMSSLSVSEPSNSPGGTDSVTISTGPDEYLRWLSVIIRREQAQAVVVASAATVDLGAIVDGSYLHISGVTTITSFGTIAAGIERTTVFDGILTLTHSTSLILPGAVNTVTAAGDCSTWRSEGAGVWRCISYQKSVSYQPLDAELTTLAGITATQATDLAAVSTFMGTVLNDADAATAQSTLGISTFVKTLLDDANAATFRTSIGVAIFESAQQTITSAGALTIAHGLGIVPRILQPWIVCTTAEHGYSIGDRLAVPLGIQAGTVSSSVSAVADATNINIRYADYTAAFNILHKTTGGAVSATNGSWRFVIVAF